MKFPLVLALAALVAGAPASGQAPSAAARRLAVEFTKKKDVTKRKGAYVLSKYREVVSQPWVEADLREYVGTYVDAGDGDRRLELALNPAGRLVGRGHDHAGDFRLVDARVDGGALSASKVYADGRRERLEAAFLLRSARTDPAGPFSRMRGLGFLEALPAGTGLVGPARIFLVKG
jgi:hypothetical protein